MALSHRFCWEVGLADPGVVKDAAYSSYVVRSKNDKPVPWYAAQLDV